MPRGAKPFVRTWDDVRTLMRYGPARRGLFAIALLSASMLVVDGCSTASPRFRNGSEGQPKSERGRAGEKPRFSSREAEEEKKEDDKRPSKEEVRGVTSGGRSFTTEKNSAIKPLDHSRMMREISKFMGVPYRIGGMDMNGMDCSGYTMVVYNNSMKKALPRTSADQARVGSPVRKEDLKFGDLVFFNTTGTRASHVGIYIGDDLFAHASVSLGVTISSLQSTYFEKRYEGARRIFK